MITKLVRWALFVWGLLMLAVMIHYATYFFGDAKNLRLNEMQMGFMAGLFYGWPSWLILPILVAMQFRESARWQSFLHLMPAVAAIGLYAAARLLMR